MSPEFPSLLTPKHIGLLLVSICLVILLRRIVLHPLARFPGPKIAAATWWYMTYYEVFKNGAFVEQLEMLHKRYGVVTSGQPCRNC